jgi:rifampicin phosphotransferase
MSTSTFQPPSPGAWELERTHATRPMARFMWDAFPPSMMRGFKDATREYGALLDHIEIAVIDGFMYTAPRPVGAPKNAKGPPPRLMFKLLVNLHPEIRRRVKRAGEVFTRRIWRDELRWWDDEVKPSIARDAQALMREDPASLSDTALADHVRRAADFLRRTIYYHHRLNCCAMIPVGDFLVHATQWTGMTPQEILRTMRGRSPLSAGATAELESLRVAILADSQAMMLLLSQRTPAEMIAALEQQPGAVGAAMREYLAVVGLRVLGGYDVSDRHAREHPELLVNIIRSAVTGTGDAAQLGATGDAVDEVRSRVPQAHRAEFDGMLEEALLTYRVRDERNFCCDSIGIGVARRAILAAGERLRGKGRVHDATHLVDASEAEIVSLLERSEGPSADELAARHQRRTTTSLDEAPDRLGFPPSAPPPPDWLPPAAARLQRSVDLVLQLMFAVPPAAKSAGKKLSGFGVSPGVFEGPARVITAVADLPLVQAGEVLVAPSTGPTFNVVLPLLRAIVTERGGALSHAAIVAREYGIPAIVGCPGATSAVKTGTRVRVDGTKGEMWILD